MLSTVAQDPLGRTEIYNDGISNKNIFYTDGFLRRRLF